VEVVGNDANAADMVHNNFGMQLSTDGRVMLTQRVLLEQAVQPLAESITMVTRMRRVHSQMTLLK
jgi:hypothetical protein